VWQSYLCFGGWFRNGKVNAQEWESSFNKHRAQQDVKALRKRRSLKSGRNQGGRCYGEYHFLVLLGQNSENFAWFTWNQFSMWLFFVLDPDKLSSRALNGTLATQPAFGWSVFFFTTGHMLLQTGFPNSFVGWRLPMLHCDFPLICTIQRRHPEWTVAWHVWNSECWNSKIAHHEQYWWIVPNNVLCKLRPATSTLTKTGKNLHNFLQSN